MAETLNFRDSLVKALPRWLQNGDIGKFAYTAGAHLDALSDALIWGIRKRYAEETSEDAAGALGAARGIVRGPAESWERYLPRLKRWITDHRTRGGAYSLLRQLYDFWNGEIEMAVMYYSDPGVWQRQRYDLDLDGNITRSFDSIDDDRFGIGYWLLIYFWPDPLPAIPVWGQVDLVWGEDIVWGSGFTATQIQDLRRVPRQWGNAATRGRVRLQYVGDPNDILEFGLGDPADPSQP